MDKATQKAHRRLMTLRWSWMLTVILAIMVAPTPGWSQGKATAQAPRAFPKAPPIKVSKWVKGKPVNTAAKGGPIVVLELWATWCGPCIKAMPHLNDLQAKHRGKIQVVALTEETPQVVQPFLNKNKNLMKFPVAIDQGGKTFAAYQKAFGFKGIPATFLIRNGEVLWHGHPSYVDKPLDAILDGTWSPDTQFRIQELGRVSREYKAHMLSEQPITPEVEAMARSIVDNAEFDPMALNNVSWALLTEVTDARRPLPVALEMAQVANRLTEGGSFHIQDTLALALFMSGDTPGAIKHQTTALDLCRAKKGQNCKGIASALERYKKAAPTTP